MVLWQSAFRHFVSLLFSSVQQIFWGLIVVLLEMWHCGAAVRPQVVKGRSDFLVRVRTVTTWTWRHYDSSKRWEILYRGNKHGTPELNLQEFMNANERGNRIAAHRLLHNLSTLYYAKLELPHTVCYTTWVLYTVPKYNCRTPCAIQLECFVLCPNRIAAHRVLHNLSTLYCAQIEFPHTVCYTTWVLYAVPK